MRLIAGAAGAEAAARVNPVAAALASTAASVAADAGRAAVLDAAAASISTLAATAPPAPPATSVVPPLPVPATSASAAVPRPAPPTTTVPSRASNSARPALPLLAAARAAERHAAVGAASAVACAASAGRRAGAAETESVAGGSSCAGIGSLHKYLRGGMADWTGRGGTPASDRVSGFTPPVPTHVLRSADTTRQTLQALCKERTIAFGTDDSDQSLGTSLLRFNASFTTKAGSDMQWLAVRVRPQVMSRLSHLSAFEAAAAHPVGVGVDAATGPPASARPRHSVPVSLGRSTTRQLATPPRTSDLLSDRNALAAGLPPPTPGASDAVARSTLRPHSRLPSKDTTVRDGASSGKEVPGDRRSSAVQAAILVQSMIEDDVERKRRLAPSQ